jgi:hypothetical protein
MISGVVGQRKLLEKSTAGSYVKCSTTEGTRMKLKKKEREFLQTVVFIAQQLLNISADARQNGPAKRRRRSSDDAVALRKQIRAARRQNVPVRQIAEDLGITPSYVYQLQR